MSQNSYLHHFSAQVSQIVFFAWFDRFTAFYNCMTWNVRKPHITTISVHKYHKSCSSFIWPFYSLLQHVWLKKSENSYLRHFSAQVSQIVFLAYLTILRFITTVWLEMLENSHLHHFRCTSIINRVLRLFDRFTVYYNCMTWNVRKLISSHNFSAHVSQIVFLGSLTILRLLTTV